MQRLKSMRLPGRGRQNDISSSSRVNINTAPDTENNHVLHTDSLGPTWHENVSSARDVLEYLADGTKSDAVLITLSCLKAQTSRYLSIESTLITPSERDKSVDSLLQTHASIDTSTRDVAVLATISVLSTKAATKHLLSLSDYETGRYLRCIILAKYLKPGCVSDQDYGYTRSLLELISRNERGLEAFRTLLKQLSTGLPLTLLSLRIIEQALDVSGIRARLKRHLQYHLQNRKLLKVYHLSRAFKQVVEDAQTDLVETLLHRYVPDWGFLRVWNPQVERITRWDEEPCVNSQKEKLFRFFDLDGPDTYTCRCSTLMLSEPACYDHTSVGIRSQEHLKHLMDLLFQAHGRGPGALDLFIHFCIDSTANETCLYMIERSLATGDDDLCRSVVSLLKSFHPKIGLGGRFEALNRFLRGLDNAVSSEVAELATVSVVDALAGTWKEAQDTFSVQLEAGGGDYLGMLIHDLGTSVRKATWLHPQLPDTILNSVHNLPPRSVLVKLFDLTNELSSPSDPLVARFKTYVLSILGATESVPRSAITLAGIDDEIRFWKHPPDSLRKDFAKNLARISAIEHATYVACLLAMLKEEDIFVVEMKHIIVVEDEKSCLRFTEYLARRRRRNQLLDHCWLKLLVSLVEEQEAQDSSFLKRMSEDTSLSEWQEVAEGFCKLIGPIKNDILQTGPGLTKERLDWWSTLSRHKMALSLLLGNNHRRRRYAWLYFPTDVNNVEEFLALVQHNGHPQPLLGKLALHLSPNGSNISTLCACIRATGRVNDFGRAVFDRLLTLSDDSTSKHIPKKDLDTFFTIWIQNGLLTDRDKSALYQLGLLLHLSEVQRSERTFASFATYLLPMSSNLMMRAKNLEKSKRMMNRQDPSRLLEISQRLGIEVSKSFIDVDGIPDELVDAASVVGDDEYELSFPLPALSTLQRKARGVPDGIRIVHVRLSLVKKEYCLHYDIAPSQRHFPRRTKGNSAPQSAVCTSENNLFNYALSRDVYYYLRGQNTPTLLSAHKAISAFVSVTPGNCLICSMPLNCKVYKRGTCSKRCSKEFGSAPLEVRCHNLLVDPLAIDLLLTSLYAAMTDESDVPLEKLFPGCPISTGMEWLLDTIPPLQSVTSAPDLQSGLEGNDGYGTSRIKLLSWLCISFRGFLLSAPHGYKIPSMPNTQQFLLVNSHHEREQLFNSHVSQVSPSGPVFHGTWPSRIYPILKGGIKNLSGTSLQLNGASLGAGIYCADDQSIPFGYARNTSKSWKNSQLHNMRVMLGCELACYAPSPSGFHVITDETKLLVRYIFLLPQDYVPPIRAHVEPAMKTAFASLRSGLTN